MASLFHRSGCHAANLQHFFKLFSDEIFTARRGDSKKKASHFHISLRDSIGKQKKNAKFRGEQKAKLLCRSHNADKKKNCAHELHILKASKLHGEFLMFIVGRGHPIDISMLFYGFLINELT